MDTTALGQFWELLGWVLALNAEAFRQLNELPYGSIVALFVVLAAGLSQAIAHSAILFVNQLKPIRLFYSLFLSAVLFAFGYLFLVFSTWLISLTPLIAKAPFGVLARTLGFSYAPLVFSIFGAMPYFGQPILTLLSVWQLLAIVIGFSAVTGATLWQSCGTVAAGGITLWLLQRTLGRPVMQLGDWIACKVAGVQMVRDRAKLKTFFQQLQISDATERLSNGSVTKRQMTEDSSRKTARRKARRKRSPARRRLSKTTRDFLSILFLALGTLLAVILLSPIKDWWFAWHNNLNSTFRLVFDLVWIVVIAIVTTALLAPLEALGWWAGWYSDTPNLPENEIPLMHSASSGNSAANAETAERYIIYLDGIDQSESQYAPGVQMFFNTLAAKLPKDFALIKGIMSYSVRNQPLTENRPLAFLWRWIDALKLKRPGTLLGNVINIRNAWIVAVSADKRYGPIYNLGMARVVYKTLLQRGYPLNSGLPVTLIGYSGGGQMSVASAPILKRMLDAPIDVISLGGVLSGNVNFLKLEHLYHLHGEKDFVERIGPVMFPKRWAVFFLSYWNRAKRSGKVSLISLGPVGHQIPGGIMDPNQQLPDGRTSLQQTIGLVTAILMGGTDSKRVYEPQKLDARQTLSNYERFRAIAPNRPETYPIEQSVSLEHYRATAPWMGRLILPSKDQRQTIHDILFEVYHAPDEFQHWVGKTVTLRLSNDSETRAYARAVTQDVHFSPQAEASVKEGRVHPTRLNHWRTVNPLESLAGAHPVDDIIVALPRSVTVSSKDSVDSDSPASKVLCIEREPVQITGRYYGLIKFIELSSASAEPDSDLFKVVHFNRQSGRFDGAEELVKVPHTPANDNNTHPSTVKDIENNSLNQTGWYIYGAQDSSGDFVVQALAPRRLLQAEPLRTVTDKAVVKHYFKKENWQHLKANKGTIDSVLLDPDAAVQTGQTPWKEGQRALLIHTYGGVGGKQAEPAAKAIVYFGHFAYGTAEVVREPLSGELRFEIVYHQIYTHNHEGLISGSLHWSRYMGDRTFGLLGLRPVVDTLIKLDKFTGDYEGDSWRRSPLDRMMYELEIMAARYRIGDGTGATFVGPANNCVQDANQALYSALRYITRSIRTTPNIKQWKQQYPDQARRLDELEQLTETLKHLLLPWGTARADWKNHADVLGSTLKDNLIQNIIRALISWRTLLPRLTSNEVTEAFLDQAASAWILRTTQVGGDNPDIEPVAPMTL